MYITGLSAIFLPQLTTNLELTPKLCGQELRLTIAIVIVIRIQIKMALPCKRNSRSGSRSGSTYPDRKPENFVPCKRSIISTLRDRYKCPLYRSIRCIEGRLYLGIKRQKVLIYICFIMFIYGLKFAIKTTE